MPRQLKVRIGYGLGAQRGLDAGGFAALVDTLEETGFDSLWLSERVGGDAPDPVIGLAVAAGRTRRMKLGTSVQVLPGRNPVLLAQELASLDVLSGGRLLPAFGLGIANPAEQQAFGVARGERAPWLDEVLPLLRRLWTEDAVDHDGPRFHYEGLRVRPHPLQQPPDIWLGGRAPSELRRIGRLADGWLASFSTPAQCAAGRTVVEAAAADASRTIDAEHFGAMLFYTHGAIPEPVADAVRSRNPEHDPSDVIASGLGQIGDRIDEYVAAGFSKLVLAPMHPVDDWRAELGPLADAVLARQT